MQRREIPGSPLSKALGGPVKLVCPQCLSELIDAPIGRVCGNCGREYPYREGVLSFLDSEEVVNPTAFGKKQEQAWAASARLRDRIRRSRVLSFINLLRVRFSMSGRRDRIFVSELRGGERDRLILDIGCGGARHYLAEYGRVIGIDAVLELLQISRNIYNEVYHASALNLPFPDQSFDVVLSSDVIGHIPAEVKDRMFSEMYRVLKPGGRTIHVIETDGTNWWLRFAHDYPELFQRYLIDLPGHISLELPSQLRARFLKAGFKEIKFKKYAGAIQECGALAATFDNEFKQKSTAIKFIVSLDDLLARNLLVKEFCSLALEPLAQVVDYFTPLDHANGVRVVFERPRSVP